MRRSLTALLGIIILFIPATLFAGDCGDVNFDSAVNIFDITHLISYLYMDGPAPDCGCGGIVTDFDGNSYQTIEIGDQCWMMENLKVTHYRNGDPIPNVTDHGTWIGLTTGAYCDYNNDTSNVAVYGRLYNWFAIDDSRNIAPEGWHVPSDAELQTLVDYLGGDAVAGGAMKETGTTHWDSPNSGATNASGFTALPGGLRDTDDMFDYMGMGAVAYFWSSTESPPNHAWTRKLYYTGAIANRLGYYKQYGYSVRCVRD